MPIITSIKVRHLQRTLYQKAKSSPKWRAWSLYGDLCRSDVLEEALRHIIANNGAPGVDGVSLRELRASPELREKFLRELQSELKAKTYKPSPVRRVLIPKANGKLRPLGICFAPPHGAHPFGAAYGWLPRPSVQRSETA